MKYFFDTEFIEHAGGIDLVSIGICAENGAEFYAESTSFNPELANEWVKENVLSHLVYQRSAPFIDYKEDGIQMCGTDQEIKNQILTFIHSSFDPKPEFYAYFASYDWVVFARLFGRLIDKPGHFPMWVIDLKQMMWERGLTTEWKQQQCPDPEKEHNALADARWNKNLYEKIVQFEVRPDSCLQFWNKNHC